MLTFRLPGGYVEKKGIVHREVELIPLTGKEEELLAQNRRQESASLVTAVLSRCVQRLGSISPVSEDVARSLLVADRQYLLLKLREVTFGERVQATISCPWPDCGRQVDINFSTRDIPIKESVDKGPLYKMELSDEAAFKNGNDKYYRKIYEKGCRKEFKERTEEVYSILDKDWDVAMQYFFLLDGIQHVFFRNKIKMMDYYMMFNMFVEDLTKKLDDDVAVLIISDHGQKKGVHTEYGFYSCNKKLGLKNPNISDFKQIIEKKVC